MERNKIFKAVRNILCGAVIGVANVIPGVSGGTMAVIMNVYDDLMNALSIKNLKKNLFFLGTVILGLIVGVLLFSKVIGFFFDHYPNQTSFFFLGLIVGSLPMLFNKTRAFGKIRPVNVIGFVIALGIMVALYIFDVNKGENGAVMAELDVSAFLLLVVAGAVSAFAMIIPGISGSLIMVLIGTYATVIGAVADLNLTILLPVGIGILLGLVAGVKLVKLLLKKAPQLTYLIILGLIIGSLLSVYPGITWDIGGIMSIVVFFIGGAMAYLFGRSDQARERKK